MKLFTLKWVSYSLQICFTEDELSGYNQSEGLPYTQKQ